MLACRTLNRIQSRIYPTAFNSNENLLVCAPTGAGKTNIAMIAVLREVASNMRDGVIQKADFKIVYVAPMKALAAEVTATFSRRLAALGALLLWASRLPAQTGDAWVMGAVVHLASLPPLRKGETGYVGAPAL